MYSIAHVYQPRYINSTRADGIGDYLRGSYFLLEFCKKHNIPLIMCINHPMNNFLKETYLIADETILNKSVYYSCNIDWVTIISDSGEITSIPDTSQKHNFEKGLLEIPIINGTRFFNCNFFPFLPIDSSHKQYVKKVLEPNVNLSRKVDTILKVLNLQPKLFVVIHVRFGDDCLLRNDFSNLSTILFFNLLRKISYIRTPLPILLITDSNKVKKNILFHFKTFKAIFRPIIHLGEGVDCSNRLDEVENTLIDFFLFSQCAKIFCFSTYIHGSGFSKWCAETYDIPYSCKFIDKPNDKPKQLKMVLR